MCHFCCSWNAGAVETVARFSMRALMSGSLLALLLSAGIASAAGRSDGLVSTSVGPVLMTGGQHIAFQVVRAAASRPRALQFRSGTPAALGLRPTRGAEERQLAFCAITALNLRQQRLLPTRSSSSSRIPFVARVRTQIGDWGRQGDYNQSEVADAMASSAAKRPIDFVISTGDNFYPSAHALPSLSLLSPKTLNLTKCGIITADNSYPKLVPYRIHHQHRRQRQCKPLPLCESMYRLTGLRSRFL